MQNHLTNEQYAFVQYLTSLNTDQNRGTLAVLRRGLSGKPVEDLNLYRFIARWVPDEDRGTPREAVYYLTAALFGLHPCVAMEGNFGGHLRRVAIARKDLDAAERRFTALLTTPLSDLAAPLRQAVTMLDELPVNWSALFADLLRWDLPQRTVQQAWANSFWAYEAPANDSKLNPLDDTEKEN